MSAVTFLKNIYNGLNKSDYLFDKNDIKKDMDFLYSFPEPKDQYERSYNQYRCQTVNQSIFLKILQNLIAIALLIGMLMKRKEKNSNLPSSCEALLLSASMNEDYIPQILREEFHNIKTSDVEIGFKFYQKDKNYMNRFIKRYLAHPFFVVKCLLKLGEYARLIDIYHPRAILVNNEFSFTSSFLNDYCMFHDIELINIMHGEKLLNIRDSFVSYSRYFVWDSYYVDLLCKLRAPKEQFRIAEPYCLKLRLSNDIPILYSYTYYLAAESKNEMLSIKNSLLKLEPDREKLCVRLHPRYSDENMAKEIFTGFHMEDKNCSLALSFAQTNCVISLYSTVLYQAYLNHKKYMIDDCSNLKKFQKLKQLEYIMLKKPSLMMSTLLEAD